MTENVQASVDARTVVPERVLVFELKTDVSKFVETAANLGFEWLASELPGPENLEADPDDDLQPVRTGEFAPELLYLTMPSRQGLDRLLAQWNRFNRGEQPSASEFRGLWELFEYLVSMRRWSVRDRIDPLLRGYVERALSERATDPVRVEIDLWYRATVSERDLARNTLFSMLEQVGGELLDLVTIEEIRYQGALASLPPEAAKRLLTLDDGNRLGGLDAVMAIRPQSAYVSTAPVDATAQPAIPDAPGPTKPCVSAMLDGYPIAEHQLLAGRVEVREVEVSGAIVPVNTRYHGTAMASLIVRGDFHVPGPAISRPLLAIPILVDGGQGLETTPRGRLPIGVVHRALTALVAEMQRPESTLRNIAVINHSVCDMFAPFTRRPSPWAMLLDYFSYRHSLLFVVSAGNIREGVTLPDFKDVNELYAASLAERQAAFINAVEREKARRGILSPAESVNSLTVGALHAEESDNAAITAFDPFPLTVVTNLASATGLGVNECIKPDVVENGGRIAALCANLPGGGVIAQPAPSQELGQLVAAPSRVGDLAHTLRSSGTSNAAALVTRGCNFIADALDDAYLGEPLNWSLKRTRAPLLKALLAHTTSWGPTGDLLERAYPPQDVPTDHMSRRRTIARFLGYGRTAIGRAISGAHNRATLVAEDSVVPGTQHVYRVPLPTSMANTNELRSITITLAWTAPITPNADYRGVRLTVLSADRSYKFWDGVERGNKLLQPDHFLVEKGTLMHIRLHGRKARALLGPDGLYFGVHATVMHTAFTSEKVPYALTISLEMAQAVRSQLFVEVQNALQIRAARIGARVR